MILLVPVWEWLRCLFDADDWPKVQIVKCPKDNQCFSLPICWRVHNWLRRSKKLWAGKMLEWTWRQISQPTNVASFWRRLSQLPYMVRSTSTGHLYLVGFFRTRESGLWLFDNLLPVTRDLVLGTTGRCFYSLLFLDSQFGNLGRRGPDVGSLDVVLSGFLTGPKIGH